MYSCSSSRAKKHDDSGFSKRKDKQRDKTKFPKLPCSQIPSSSVQTARFASYSGCRSAPLRGSMVIRLRPCMTSSHPSPPAPPFHDFFTILCATVTYVRADCSVQSRKGNVQRIHAYLIVYLVQYRTHHYTNH